MRPPLYGKKREVKTVQLAQGIMATGGFEPSSLVRNTAFSATGVLATPMGSRLSSCSGQQIPGAPFHWRLCLSLLVKGNYTFRFPDNAEDANSPPLIYCKQLNYTCD